MHIRKFLLILLIPLFASAPVRGFSSASSTAAFAAGNSAGGEKSIPGMFLGGGSAADADDQWRKIGDRIRPHFGEFVDSIIVEGNTHTERETIVREMSTRQGAPLEERLIQRDISFIRGMGYFSDVDISVERVSAGRCRVTVHIVERPGLFMRIPYPVVNYDFEKGVSYGIRWRIKNFRGLGEEVRLLALKRRDKEQGGDIAWNVPWLMGRRLRMNLNLFAYRRLEEPESDDYIKERLGTSAYFGIPLSSSLLKQLWLGTTLSIEARESRLTCTPDGVTTSELYRQNLVALGLELIYDSRDNRISPWAGFYSRLRAIRFTSIHGLEQQYIFYYMAQNYYLPIRSLGTLIFSLTGDVREGDLPYFFEMGIGGTGDLRGYPDNDLRGRAKVLGAVQLRRHLYGPRVFDIPWVGKFDLAFNGVAFVDTGALMDCLSEIADSKYEFTGGLGIEILSPIQDIVRVELAGDGEGFIAFYFTSGVRF